MTATTGNSAAGLVALKSTASFAATLKRLDGLLNDRGIKPILRLDHAAAAASVGLSLRPLLLLLFGDPRVGTALMQENPTAGIDLPLKLLVWEDEQGSAWIGYNDPAWIEERHGLNQSQSVAVKMASLLHSLALGACGLAGS